MDGVGREVRIVDHCGLVGVGGGIGEGWNNPEIDLAVHTSGKEITSC